MKKILTFAAVAALAVASHAATTTWGSGALNVAASADGGWGSKTVAASAGNQIVTMSIYFVTAADYNDMASYTQKELYDSYNGKTADLTGQNINANNGAVIGAVTIRDTASAESVIYAVAIATYSDSTLKQDFYMATLKASTYNNTTKTGTATGIFTSDSTKNWQAVPEPTTVALLALGLAAVGLKRKVA